MPSRVPQIASWCQPLPAIALTIFFFRELKHLNLLNRGPLATSTRSISSRTVVGPVRRPFSPIEEVAVVWGLERSTSRPSANSNGDLASNKHGHRACVAVAAPATLSLAPQFLSPIRVSLCPAALDTLPSRIFSRYTNHPARPPVATIVTGRNMGVYTTGGAQEEDVAHEEEAPADGRQGVEGCQCLVPVSVLR